MVPNNVSETKKQSVIGIISILIAVITAVVMLILFGFAAYLESNTPGGVDEKSPSAVIAGLGIVGTLVFFLIGAVLGFAGLFQSSRKKFFSVIGAFLNLFLLLTVIGVIMLGILKG